MFLRLLVTIACLHVVQDARLNKGAIHWTGPPTVATDLATDQFNDWAERYKEFHLGNSLVALQYWEPRVALEDQGMAPSAIVDRFLAEMTEDRDPWRILSPTQVHRYALLAAAQGGHSIDSPLEIARTLYGIVIGHLPRADVALLYQSGPELPVSEFIGRFRKNDGTQRFIGIEHRITTWVRSLHGLARIYFTQQGMLSTNVVGSFCTWMTYTVGKRVCGVDVADPFKTWLDMVLVDLGQVETDLKDAWIPELWELYNRIENDDQICKIKLPSPVEATADNLPISVLGVDFVDRMLGLLSGPTTKTVSTLKDAFDYQVLFGEFDQIAANFEHLRVSCAAFRTQLETVQGNFADLMHTAVTNGPSAQQNKEWVVQKSWDDVGVVIPGDELPLSKNLRQLNGVVVVPLLPDGDDGETDVVGFVFRATDADADVKLLNIVSMNVAAFLDGGTMYQFLQLSGDVGSIVALYQRDLPTLTESQRVFRYEKVENMALYEPAFSELAGPEGLVGEDLSGAVWYVKELTLHSMFSGLARRSMQRTVATPVGDAQQASLTDGDGTPGKVLGNLEITYAAQVKLSKGFLGSS